MKFSPSHAYNYGCIYGNSLVRKFKIRQKDYSKVKQQQKEKGIYMLPIRQLNVDVEKSKDRDLKPLQTALSYLHQDEQDKILELAKNMPDPITLIDEALAIQHYRVAMGLQDEKEYGHLQDSTEVAVQNLVSMINSKKVIAEGMNVNVNVENSITAILDEINDENDDIEINKINEVESDE